MTIELTHSFAGAWQVRNSPADRVPSHGTTRFASAQAIDFVPVGGDERTAPLTWRSLLRPEPPERHVHVQAIDRLPVEVASAVPMSCGGRLPHNDEVVQG